MVTTPGSFTLSWVYIGRVPLLLEQYCDILVRDYERRNDIRDGLFS
jgi:hypothetical protein